MPHVLSRRVAERRWWAWGTAGLVVVAGVVTVVLSLTGGGGAPVAASSPRARVYAAYDACLLTDVHGLSGDAVPVWAGMERASVATRMQVSNTSVVAGVAPGTFVNTLAAGCDVVVAVGGAQVGAAGAAAGSFPAVKFVLVGSGTPGGNVAVVRAPSAAAVAADVEDLLSEAMAGRFAGRDVR